ncbi:hypothetical protein LCL97_24540 [Seohaeicola saemankumensis]|nr:hypothetical protein [Seohaeicola saemankumensis]MCA0873995.1 hypothetical protein [Seohaeicola saemankumensis]
MVEMSLKPDSNNPIPALSFLNMEMLRSDDRDDYGGTLTATLDFKVDEAETRLCVYEVGFSAASLTLEYEGFKPILESRYALEPHPIVVEHQHTTTIALEKNKENGLKVIGDVGGPIPRAGAEWSENTTSNQSNTHQVSHVQQEFLVSPYGDGSWHFTGQGGGPLRGNLIPSLPIVELEHAQGNRKHVHARIVVKQRDLWFKLVDGTSIVSDQLHRFTRRRRTQEKLAAIVLAKAISKRSGVEKYRGIFTVSESVLSDGSDDGV